MTDQSLPGHGGDEGELFHEGQRLTENPIRRAISDSVDIENSIQPVDIVIDKSAPLVSGLNQDEKEVSEEEHERVVEHDDVEECPVREDQVDDVGDEEAEHRDAQHDGVDDAEKARWFPRQTDVNHPGSLAQPGVSRGQTEQASPHQQSVPSLVSPLPQNKVRPSSPPLQQHLVITEVVRVQLGLNSQLVLTHMELPLLYSPV